MGVPGFEDEQCRAIAATIGDLRVIDLFVVNGQAVDSDMFQYQAALARCRCAGLAEEQAKHPKLVVGDKHRPRPMPMCMTPAWAGQVLCTDQERAAVQPLAEPGPGRLLPQIPPTPKTFSWWGLPHAGVSPRTTACASTTSLPCPPPR